MNDHITQASLDRLSNQLSQLEIQVAACIEVARRQAEDAELWEPPANKQESYLQAALRLMHFYARGFKE